MLLVGASGLCRLLLCAGPQGDAGIPSCELLLWFKLWHVPRTAEDRVPSAPSNLPAFNVCWPHRRMGEAEGVQGVVWISSGTDRGTRVTEDVVVHPCVVSLGELQRPS